MKIFIAILIAAPLVLAGCVGITREGERQARHDVRAVGEVYRPKGERPVLPKLTNDSGFDDFMRHAMLNQPQVEAAYFDWAASVERITVERSLPDPRLTFQADIADIIMSLMPGLMMDFPGPGKLGARAQVASEESRGKYFQFESAVLQAAFALKKSFYQLYFLDEKIRVNQQTLDLLADLEKLARSQNEVGKVTLQDVLRAQVEQDRLRTETVNLDDSRHSLMAQFKAALGLTSDQPDPPVPAKFASTPVVSDEQLWTAALARNPELKAMAAEVRRAEALLRLAHKERVPDFNLGLEADALAAPTMFRPQFGMTLPIWRDKIAAEIAGAQAENRAAKARLTAAQISLAVEFAEKSFMFREASRNLDLLQKQLLPKTRLSLEVARSGYLSGQIDFFNVIDTERTLLNFTLAEIEARTQRELTLAELSLVIAGLPPVNAPVLNQTPVKSTNQTKKEKKP